MIENYRSGLVWDTFMANEPIQRAMKLAGFRPLTPADTTQPNVAVYGLARPPRDLRNPQIRRAEAVATDKTLRWQHLQTPDAAMRFAFSWNPQALGFHASVRDATPAYDQPAETLFKGDCVELYIDPDADGLSFGNRNDIQIGMAPTDKCVEFFGGRKVAATVTPTQRGYDITARLPWDVLGVTPQQGGRLRMSVSLNDAGNAKTDWDFRPRGQRFLLGELVLE
jgi:hypothetical protein